MTAGCLIAIEGTDGAGKAIIAREVVAALAEAHPRVVFMQKTHPPADTGYAAYHLTRLREILWDYEPAADLASLGDRHWLSLIASWFHALDFYAVQSRLEKGCVIITDGWYYKYLARFLLKSDPIGVEARQAFASVRGADHVILLDVAPATAEWRKTRVTRSERGELESHHEEDALGFVAYQSRVREKLLTLRQESWSVLRTDGISVQTVVDRATALVRQVAGLTPATHDASALPLNARGVHVE